MRFTVLVALVVGLIAASCGSCVSAETIALDDSIDTNSEVRRLRQNDDELEERGPPVEELAQGVANAFQRSKPGLGGTSAEEATPLLERVNSLKSNTETNNMVDPLKSEVVSSPEKMKPGKKVEMLKNPKGFPQPVKPSSADATAPEKVSFLQKFRGMFSHNHDHHHNHGPKEEMSEKEFLIQFEALYKENSNFLKDRDIDVMKLVEKNREEVLKLVKAAAAAKVEPSFVSKYLKWAFYGGGTFAIICAIYLVILSHHATPSYYSATVGTTTAGEA